MMRILYPQNPLNAKEADEPYLEEYLCLKEQGITCFLFDFDALNYGDLKVNPKITDNEVVLYRGWMLTCDQYQHLDCFLGKYSARLCVSFPDYLKNHYIVNWYSRCKDWTPETHFFEYNQHLKENIEQLSWDAYFVKDYVKSNSTEIGSIAHSADEVIQIVELIKQYRGMIEGGVAIRRVEEFMDETEQRYFVFNGKVYSPMDEAPAIVYEIAKVIESPFFTIDIVRNSQGEYRLIEIGDGQVSDKKQWPLDKFVAMMVEICGES